MKHVWWRTHLRALADLGPLARFGDFQEVDGFLPYLLESLELPAGGSVLELGCGRGSFSIRLAEWGYRVTGVEESEPMLALARTSAERRGVELELRCASRRTVPERNTFDGALILDFGSLSDVENADQLRSVAAALRPGGRVVFSTCNPHYWARASETEHEVREGADVLRRNSFDFEAGCLLSRVRCIFAD
ncbi:MAG: class I SAM-dependent methyltransferase, partial [Armatimonadetes bacterium]|nr:class I SAM-dependent methyltransferase [Armatimonadota bacterium]